jgi:hypothetical protein
MLHLGIMNIGQSIDDLAEKALGPFIIMMAWVLSAGH